MDNSFVWLTDNYCVNISSIFSLEKQLRINDEFKKWVNDYDKLLNEYKTLMPPLTDDNGIIHELTNESTQEDIYLYSELIKDKIYDKIGEEPDEYEYKYIVILSTGVKVSITEDKFDIICKYINKG